MPATVPPVLSAELRLLLHLLQRSLGTAAAVPPAAPDLRGPALLALIRRHRVASFLHGFAAADLAARCPAPVTAEIARQAAENLQRSLRHTADQLDFARRLEAAGIEVAAIKGFVLARQLHGRVGARHAGDIDLLVRPADVAAADAVIRGAGLRRSRPDFELTPRQAAAYVRLKPEYEYLRDAPSLRLELLWRLEDLPPVDTLWPHLITVEDTGRRWRTLPPAVNTLYLFQHGARHGWFRLFWLVDIAVLLRADGFDAAAVLTAARRHGGLRAVWQGAALCEQLLGVDLPPELRPPSRLRPGIAALVREALRQIAAPLSNHESTGEWLRQALYRARIHDTLPRQFAALTPHLVSPLNWRTLRLPDRLFFLYAPLSPLLWFWRAARRGGWSR